MNKDYISTLAEKAEQNNRIPPHLYTEYNVKRGLRNSNGTGVLVGLTEIGDVHGYIIDEGEKVPVEGDLRYRGIPVRELVNGLAEEARFGFEEATYLLLFGELPDKKSLEAFISALGEQKNLPHNFFEDMILKAPSSDIMNKLARSVLALYSYDDNPDDVSVYNVLRQSISLISRFPLLAAYGYQAKAYHYMGKSLVVHTPDPQKSIAENFLMLMRADGDYTRTEAETLDLSLVLHAEHGGGNNSTFVSHAITSTGTDIYSSVAGAIGSLKGPRHGGANIKVKQMMDELKQNVNDWKNEELILGYLQKILSKEAFDRSGLIYGIGHAVYTLSDPRCILLKEKAKILAAEKKSTDEYELYELVEKLAPEAFTRFKNNDKVVSANVDFYSGLVYSMLGIPGDLYTPVFAVSRISGWCAHIIEEIVNGGKIMRPAYKNVQKLTNYIPLDQR
ncbi:MAG: citrate/2-methylcitrate synthase [Clostridia bacterium]